MKSSRQGATIGAITATTADKIPRDLGLSGGGKINIGRDVTELTRCTSVRPESD